MRISGKLSPEQITEVRRLLRPSWYWPKLLASHLHGLALASALIYLFFNLVFEKDWRDAALCFLANAILWGYAAASTMRTDKKDLARFQQSLPEWLEVHAHGVEMFHSDGRKSYFPRSILTEAARGRSVLLVRVIPENSLFFVPLSSLSERVTLDALQLQ